MCLPADEGWVMTGGGPIDHWEGSGDGNLLTASYPDLSVDPSHPQCWIALGKDQKHPSAAKIQSQVFGLRVKP
jgi:hypothetical protein